MDLSENLMVNYISVMPPSKRQSEIQQPARKSFSFGTTISEKTLFKRQRVERHYSLSNLTDIVLSVDSLPHNVINTPIATATEISMNYLQKLIPDEVLLKICHYVRPKDLCRLACTCKRIYEICEDNKLWERLHRQIYTLDYPLQKTKNNLYEVVSLISGPGRPETYWKKFFPLLYGAHHVSKDQQLSRQLQHLGRKCYGSIEEALNNKAPIILVHSGTYEESVEVNHQVTIIGTGIPGTPSETCITNTSKTIFRFGPQAAKSIIAFLSISILRDEASSSVGYCLDVGQDSSPIIQNCHITSKSTCVAAVHVHGPGSSPKVVRCKISECNNVGLYIHDGAQGVFEDNEISSNRLAGVWVKTQANPIMKRNEICHGKDAGFFIFDGGMGYYEENNVHSNRIAGIEVRSEANPTVVRCHIHHGFTGGIYVHDSGRGEFLCNQIHSNTFAGVWVTSGSNPTIKDNNIYHGEQGGIYVFGEGRGLIENNDIYGNALAGIQIRSNSNPIVRKNRIHHGKHGGIYIHECGMGLIEDNEIYGNTLAGIWITTGSAPILRLNRIHSGKQVGVYFYDKGCGTLENNEIYNHKYSGIQIRSGSSPVIRKNKIWGGKNGGVLIYNGGLGILEDNEIFDNAMAGVWIKTESNPILRRNKIHDGHEGGICIFNNGKGLLEDNDIFRNALTGVLISSQSFPVLRRNRIFQGGAAGIEITNGAGGVLERNEIFNNKFDGICLATGVEPKLIDNNCHDNKEELSEAIEEGKCLYQVSGNACYPMHDFYKCVTCSSTENLAICVNCIKKCHQGHEVQFVRHDRFFCDCGAGTTPNCCQLVPSSQSPTRDVTNNNNTQQHQNKNNNNTTNNSNRKRKSATSSRTRTTRTLKRNKVASTTTSNTSTNSASASNNSSTSTRSKTRNQRRNASQLDNENQQLEQSLSVEGN
ncbi:F-box only protein 11-like isoform X1 [Clytia hemisphaerica]|uniref:F-box only protein 11 n=2 Tax=Clytia hemisphaerica TaxID=252671 RepID=A0A7M5X452_9CNID